MYRIFTVFLMSLLATVTLAQPIGHKVRQDEKLGAVFLHGAGLGSWIWNDVVSRVEIPSLAIDLLGRANKPGDFRDLKLHDFVDDVLIDIDRSGFDRIFLVAHSASGPLALELASRLRGRIQSLIFVGAGIPRNGERYVDRLSIDARELIERMAQLYPEGLRAPDFIIRNALCNDLSDAETERVVSHIVPESPRLFLDPVTWVKPQRSIYVRLLTDRSDLSPELQSQMAKDFGVTGVVDIRSGHLPMLGHPEELAEIINSEIGTAGE